MRKDVGVVVPGLVGFADGDEAHACFHQAPGEEASLPHGGAAVLVAEFFGLLCDVEGLSWRAGERMSSNAVW